MPPVFGPLDPMTRHSAGLFLCKPQASGFFSISFLQITPVTMSIHIPHFCTVNNRLKPGLMPQSSAAYESARDWRSAGGLFGEILLRCRPANPLTALRRHPEALARIEASLGRADFNAWGASVLTAFAADCAVWANEAFGQSLLACGLALMGTHQLPQLLCRSRPDSIPSKSMCCARRAGGRSFWARWLLPGNR